MAKKIKKEKVIFTPKKPVKNTEGPNCMGCRHGSGDYCKKVKKDIKEPIYNCEYYRKKLSI